MTQLSLLSKLDHLRYTSLAHDPLGQGRRPRRRSFTLVELLVIMMIFSILLSIVLTGISAAEFAAKKAHTQNLVNRLSEIILARYNKYLERRVPIYIDQSKYSPQQMAKLRLDALHELMRLELPDRLTDILDDPITKYADPATGSSVVMQRPAISLAYQKRLAASGVSSATSPYQGAECLYMIITLGSDEGVSREFFNESDVGDVDSNGLPEFLDSWGNPIRFIRWPTAFIPANGSDTQLQSDETITDANGNKVYKYPDPYDPMKFYSGYAIYPLIYSGGPDGLTGIQADISGLHYSKINNNPFDASVKSQIGLTSESVNEGNYQSDGKSENWHDNIHNHFNVID